MGMTAQPHWFHREKGMTERPIMRKREVWRV
jgi:hypothetical protein